MKLSELGQHDMFTVPQQRVIHDPSRDARFKFRPANEHKVTKPSSRDSMERLPAYGVMVIKEQGDMCVVERAVQSVGQVRLNVGSSIAETLDVDLAEFAQLSSLLQGDTFVVPSDKQFISFPLGDHATGLETTLSAEHGFGYRILQRNPRGLIIEKLRGRGAGILQRGVTMMDATSMSVIRYI